MSRRWPTPGKLTWWDRILGWYDIRCSTCGTIGGAGKSHRRVNDGTIRDCSHCPSADRKASP